MKREGPDPWSFEAFLWLPTADQHPPNPLHLRIGIAFLRQCEEARMPVIVLCMAGVGRSSSLVLAHLLAGSHRGKDPEEALAFLCARRACVNPSPDQIAAAVEAARAFEG
jgi:protein-tyrosine phosphatase